MADLGKKISFIQKQQFKDGLRTNKGKNNPNYGKTTSQRTPEQLEKYSLAAIDRLKNNLIKIRGQFESLKTGKKISFRSSLEKQFIECWFESVETIDGCDQMWHNECAIDLRWKFC